MCLKNTFSEEKIQEFLNNIGDNGITVYKVVWIADDDHCYPIFKNRHVAYRNGIEEAYQANRCEADNGTEYDSGFHFYLRKVAAERFLHYIYKQRNREIYPGRHKIVSANVKREWITTVGREAAISENLMLTVRAVETVVVAKIAYFNLNYAGSNK